MKRWTVMVMALVCGISGLTAFGAGPGNLLRNSRFDFRTGSDNAPVGWTAQGGERANCFVDTNVTHNGAAALRVEANVTGDRLWNMVHRPVTGIRANTPYTVSGWVKTEGLREGSLAYISLNCFSAQAKRLAVNDSPEKVSGTTDWKRIVFTVPELPKGTQTARFSVCLYGFGKAWFTELQVEEGESVSPYRPGTADIEEQKRLDRQLRDRDAWLEKYGLPRNHNGRPRIGILDLGLANHVSGCGFPSRPEIFEHVLNPRYETVRLSGEMVANPAILHREMFDLLIVPSGSFFPSAAADSLIMFLSSGGSLLACGGYAFDKPVDQIYGRWDSVHDLPRKSVIGEVEVPIPPSAKWQKCNTPGYATEVRDIAGHNGRNGIEVSTLNLQTYNTATVPFPKVDTKDWSLISFWAKGSPNTKKVWFELDEDDGSRWHYAVPLKESWQLYSLIPQDFVYWSDNASIGRGDAGDRVCFSRVNRIIFGVATDIAESNAGHSASLSDIRVGTDPLQSLHETVIPQINTRTGLIRDAIHPKYEQIGAFDPSFTLRHVAKTETSREMAGVFPPIVIDGALDGLSAIAQLGVNGHGFGPNRACWRPLLSCADAQGQPRGHAGAIVQHFTGTFAGSSWAIFGVDNRDLFAAESPVTQQLLLPVVETLLRRFYLNGTTAEYACYRHGETAKLLTRVSNFSTSPRKGKVVFRLADESLREIATFSREANIEAGKSELIAAEWPIPDNAPDFLYLTAGLETDGKKIDRETGAMVIWNEKVIANGPRLRREGLRLTIDGESRFFMGCQTFWGQHLSVTARSPLNFFRDFQQMREHGLRWTRCFLTFHNEHEKRVSDAVVQLAQKFGIVLYHTPNLGNTADPKQLENENQTIAEIASRYREVPGFAIDICNEPALDMENPAFKSRLGDLPPKTGHWNDAYDLKRYQTASAIQRQWAKTNLTAVKRIAPAVPVSVGWSQGWAGGSSTKDPQLASLDLDFTDRHYYGDPINMPQEIKDLDLRVLGKPLLVGECGAKNHPTFKSSDPWGMGDDDESYDYRFRYLVSHAFGLGATALLSWHWRDPMEGIFPCGLVHSTGVPRPTAALFRKMADTFGKLELADNPPDTVIVMGEHLRHTSERGKVVSAAHTADQVLVWHGVNHSKLTDSMLSEIPESVRLIIYPAAYVLSESQIEWLERFVERGGTLVLSGNPVFDASGAIHADWLKRLCGAHAKEPLPLQPFAADLPAVGNYRPELELVLDTASDWLTKNGHTLISRWKRGNGCVIYNCAQMEAQGKEMIPVLRSLYGKAIEISGVSKTRTPSDPPDFETFRVPGKNATGWVFWNGGDKEYVTQRDGHAIKVPPRHIGYLQIGNGGTLQVREVL